jgi:hypothetical protein
MLQDRESVGIDLAEVLANKIEYCELIGDVSYTLEDFWREQGMDTQPDYINVCLVKQAQKVLERRQGGALLT